MPTAKRRREASDDEDAQEPDTPRSGAGEGELSQTVCSLCRHRKARCDRRKPRCGLCIKNDMDCEYVVTQKKRGLRAGYVSELERRLEVLERDVRDLKSQRPILPEIHSFNNVNDLDLSFQNNIDPMLGVEPITPNSAPGPTNHSNAARQWSQSTQENALPASPIDANKIASGIETLSPPILAELLDTWFSDYYRWIPILHKPSLLDTLHTPFLKESQLYIVLKAITAVTVTDTQKTRLSRLCDEDRQRLALSFRCQVVMEAMGSLSLQSLQALLVITILDYGAGKFSDFWNLVALCKRMATQLGLRDMVQGDHNNQRFTVPPRMLPAPNNSIEREERVRAYWMTEALDGYSTLGAAWNVHILRPPLTKVLPCNEDDWECTEPMVDFLVFGDFESPSSFALYVSFVTNELFEVHQFLQQSLQTTTTEECETWDREFRKVEGYLKDWRARNSSIAGPYASYVMSPGRTTRFDPTIVLANTGYNIAIIALYSRLALPPHGFENYLDAKSPALERCLDACNDLASIIGAISDEDLQCICPHFIFDMFVAARFFLVNARAFETDLPANLNILLHAYSICQKRWHLARNLEKVLRTAIAEHNVPLAAVSLPPQFYDMQYVALDIYEALRIWAETSEPTMNLQAVLIPLNASVLNEESS